MAKSLKTYTKEDMWEIARDGVDIDSDEEIKNDFIESFSDIFIIKKMINTFLCSSSVNAKLIINKVITILNVFGKKKTNILLRMTCEDNQFTVVKAILMYLHSYDFAVDTELPPNRIMVDILKDIDQRYSLDHIK